MRRSRDPQHGVGRQDPGGSVRGIHGVERPDPGPPGRMRPPHVEGGAPDEQAALGRILRVEADAPGPAADRWQGDRGHSGHQGDREQDRPGAAADRPEEQGEGTRERGEARIPAAGVREGEGGDLHGERPDRHEAPPPREVDPEQRRRPDPNEQEARQDVRVAEGAVDPGPDRPGEGVAEPVRRGGRAARVLAQPDDRFGGAHEREPREERPRPGSVGGGHRHRKRRHHEGHEKEHRLPGRVPVRGGDEREERERCRRGQRPEERPGERAAADQQPAPQGDGPDQRRRLFKLQQRQSVLREPGGRQERHPSKRHPGDEPQHAQEHQPVERRAPGRPEPDRGYRASHPPSTANKVPWT